MFHLHPFGNQVQQGFTSSRAFSSARLFQRSSSTWHAKLVENTSCCASIPFNIPEGSFVVFETDMAWSLFKRLIYIILQEEIFATISQSISMPCISKHKRVCLSGVGSVLFYPKLSSSFLQR
eukprot:m.115319 g.115319  ORF g.115319 m.115319 type:complete len:122 (+) comp15365_c0_seq7:831-1196(+)